MMACFPTGCDARVPTPFALYAWKGGHWSTRVSVAPGDSGGCSISSPATTRTREVDTREASLSVSGQELETTHA